MPAAQHPRLLALVALQSADFEQKAALALDLWTFVATNSVAIECWSEPQYRPADALRVPGRPDRPIRRPAREVPARSPFTLEGRAALVHSICHIEFNAINLALDAAWRFDGMPAAFYLDWLRVAAEEAQHFQLLHTQLQSMGWCYGDFDAHDGLWTMCEKTAADVLARMALVPRTLEARGLDATPLIQAKLRRVNMPDALRTVEILDTILRDEVGHVAIGNHWYRWLCERQGLEPVAHYRLLARRYEAPRLKAPFNLEARGRAGFSDEELAVLEQEAAKLLMP